MGRLAPDLYVQDAVVPRTQLPEVLAKVCEISRRAGLRLANVFHAGDGNLHPNICYDGRDPDEVARVIEAGREIVQACLAAGGALSGEHGIGLEKKESMPPLFSDDDLGAMARVRAAFNPDDLMNPGKVLPTPRACVEVPGPYRQHPLEREGVIDPVVIEHAAGDLTCTVWKAGTTLGRAGRGARPGGARCWRSTRRTPWR